MIRPPRRSTLFPYPTLFRSAAAVAGDLSPLVAGYRICVHIRKDSQIAELTVTPQERPGEMRGVAHVAHDVAPLAKDRKSTRLNSSHLVISYAVFCLKKNTSR